MCRSMKHVKLPLTTVAEVGAFHSWIDRQFPPSVVLMLTPAMHFRLSRQFARSVWRMRLKTATDPSCCAGAASGRAAGEAGPDEVCGLGAQEPGAARTCGDAGRRAVPQRRSRRAPVRCLGHAVDPLFRFFSPEMLSAGFRPHFYMQTSCCSGPEASGHGHLCLFSNRRAPEFLPFEPLSSLTVQVGGWTARRELSGGLVPGEHAELRAPEAWPARLCFGVLNATQRPQAAWVAHLTTQAIGTLRGAVGSWQAKNSKHMVAALPLQTQLLCLDSDSAFLSGIGALLDNLQKQLRVHRIP